MGKSKFNISLVKNNNISKKDQKTLKIYLKQKRKLTMQDIEDINATFKEKLGHERFLIRAFNNSTRPTTLKPMHGDLNLMEMDDYLAGRVDFDNFNYADEYYQIHISFMVNQV
jgi:hypothetical protein